MTFRTISHLLAGVSLAMIASAAQAQVTPPAGGGIQPGPDAKPTPPEQQPQSSAEPVGDSSVAHPQDTANATPNDTEVVVTGSRTIKNGNASPSPVTIVSTQDVRRTQPAGTLSEALAILPVFAGSRGPASNPSTTGTAAAGNGAANQLNLRNLGSNRTLVLLDGYRVPPTTANGITDADIIPQLLVQRVDTVTGGVSAVYGSDAVAGVVNFVLDKKFAGVSITANAGISQRGDAGKQDVSIAAGTGLFGGRGHIEGSYEYINQDGILARSNRSYLNLVGVAGSVPGTTAAAGSAANPYQLFTNVRQANLPFGGLISCGATCSLNGQTFGTDGVARAFVHGATTGTTNLEIGGDGGYYDSSLIAPLKANQVFGRFDFDVTNTLHFYAQVSGDLKTNTSYADTLSLSGYTFSSANAFLSPAYQTALSAAGTTFKLSELVNDLPKLNAVAKSSQWLYSGGFDGTLGTFRFGVNYTHGVAQLNTTLNNNPNYQHIDAALDAVKDASGNIVCQSAAANPGCVPLNLFGPTAASAAAGYVLGSTHYHTVTKLDSVTAHVEGSPFSTWAGPVNAAISGEIRTLSFRSTSDAQPTDFANCTGIRYNCVASGTTQTSLWGFTFAASPRVSQTVKEGAVEIDVPLVKDVSFIRSLSVNGAARYTSYTTSGDYWTWKIGADWHLTDTLRLRGTRSRDIRAPTLYEQFAPTGIVPVKPTDLLTGQSPSVPEYDLSNPNLKAEIGSTLTAGAVWTPTRRFSIAVDYYHIKLADAIVQVTGSASNIQQACYSSGGTSIYCALQLRPNGFSDTSAANAVTRWYSQYLNIGEIRTYGVDVEANYSATLFARPASLRLLADYQPHVYYVQPGTTTTDQGDVAFGPLGLSAGPSVRLTGFARFQPAPHFTVDLLERWRNSMKLGGDPSQYWVSNHIAPFATTSLTLTYDFAARFGKGEFFVNVNNLFDADPPVGGYSGNGTRAGLRDGFALGDDVVGRAFTFGARLRF